jgi:hypothetical protein
LEWLCPPVEATGRDRGRYVLKLALQPVTLRAARAFVDRHHRHHDRPQGGKFAIGVNDGESLVGVAIIGRPVARHFDDGYTAEVVRCCVLDGHPNACSMLYGAAWRASKAMGYRQLYTYTRVDESGGALVASGWKCLGQAGGGSWSRPSRPRVDKTDPMHRILWEASCA